eukprot:COSAG02_NODE_891_length_16139_cov_29.045885_14_plen_143_part_00
MRSTSRRCGSVCAAARSGAFQRRNLDLLLSLAASALTARARRCPPSPAPARAAGRSIRPLCGSAVCLSTRAARCVVLAVRRSRGGPRGRARPWWASPRDHRDHRGDGGQDADGGDAERHLLVLYGGPADGVFADVSEGVRLD